MKPTLLLIVCIVLTACSVKTSVYSPAVNVDQRIEALMEEYDAASVGIGIIRNGALVWTGYYGEESSGKPIGPQSMFNTASTNKAITAETAWI